MNDLTQAADEGLYCCIYKKTKEDNTKTNTSSTKYHDEVLRIIRGTRYKIMLRRDRAAVPSPPPVFLEGVIFGIRSCPTRFLLLAPAKAHTTLRPAYTM